jgi:predicted amidophosphoribosyltransferase
MWSRAETKPCPVCGKPIKPQASKCWFCGEVFDTEPCAHCGTPVKKSSTYCGFCGEPTSTHIRLSPEAGAAGSPEPDQPRSEAIQSGRGTSPPGSDPRVSESTGTQDCPRCGEVIPLAAVRCKHCGASLEEDEDDPYRPGRRTRWRSAPVRRPHRGGTILALAIVSLCFCGVILGPAAVIMAIVDLNAMNAGRMDPSGTGLTWAGLVIGVLSTLAAVALIYIQLGLIGQ